VPSQWATDPSTRDVDKRHTSYDFTFMVFTWRNEKNQLLKKTRGISFEKVVICIEQGRILDIVEHPNIQQYPTQKLYILNIDDYAYIVPFEDKDDRRELKTIFPSRVATRDYLRGDA
jgi:hypothetical protein